jgi:hypothetical protein
MRFTIHKSSISATACRSGVVLIVTLVLFVICTTLFTLWARTAVHEQTRLASNARWLQAERLAEAGLARAAARRAADSNYDGELWSIPAAELGGNHLAEVRIRIAPADDAARARIEAIAVYPVDSERRAQVTRRVDISTRSASSGGDAS